MQHDWVPSTLGHGETMCRRCWITNREAAVLGETDHCNPPPPKAANTNMPAAPQDRIADELAPDDVCEDDEVEDADPDGYSECGRWNGGHLTRQCRLAGSEWCDWDCPIGIGKTPRS